MGGALFDVIEIVDESVVATTAVDDNVVVDELDSVTADDAAGAADDDSVVLAVVRPIAAKRNVTLKHRQQTADNRTDSRQTDNRQ